MELCGTIGQVKKMESALSHKFSYSYIFETRQTWCKPLIFQTQIAKYGSVCMVEQFTQLKKLLIFFKKGIFKVGHNVSKGGTQMCVQPLIKMLSYAPLDTIDWSNFLNVRVVIVYINTHIEGNLLTLLAVILFVFEHLINHFLSCCQITLFHKRWGRGVVIRGLTMER